MLMEFNRNTEEVFPLDCDEAVLGSWVNDRVIEFIDTYLRLEIHPFYQKDNTVLDIVCGMRISSISATSSVERHGRYSTSAPSTVKKLSSGETTKLIWIHHLKYD